MSNSSCRGHHQSGRWGEEASGWSGGFTVSSGITERGKTVLNVFKGNEEEERVKGGISHASITLSGRWGWRRQRHHMCSPSVIRDVSACLLPHNYRRGVISAPVFKDTGVNYTKSVCVGVLKATKQHDSTRAGELWSILKQSWSCLRLGFSWFICRPPPRRLGPSA